MARGHHARSEHAGDTRARLVGFLTARLTEDLGRVWARDDPAGGTLRPGMASQVAVLDELLVALRRGRLPAPSELRILLLGYGLHPDYDPLWGETSG